MKYQFIGSLTEKNTILIPFNVWEVCDSQGNLSAEGFIDNSQFICTLSPLGNGTYEIPVSDEVKAHILDTSKFNVVFQIHEHVQHLTGTSPYSQLKPIRKIDSMRLITQPNDGLCGQTCIAMLADVSLEEACEIMHCRDWQASMGKMIETLYYLGIPYDDTIHYTQGRPCILPDCAILMEKMGRYSHYLIFYKGTYYDPTMGILEHFDKNNLVGYLEIGIV